MKTKQLGRPTDHCRQGRFPEPLKKAPPAAVHLLGVTARIMALTEDHGVRAVAREADISDSTLSRTITGEIWPSAIAVASIEQAYGINLWTDQRR